MVYEFKVMGVELQAQITLTLESDWNFGNAYGEFNTGPNAMTLYGDVSRYTTSGIVEGASQYIE